MKCVRTFLVGSAGLILGCSILYLAFPGIRSSLRAEDKVVETISAALFFLSAVSACVLLVRRKGDRLLLFFLLAMGSVCFLDECSFGQRLMGFSTPRIAGVNIDGVHDMVEVVVTLLRSGNALAIAVSACVVLILGIVAFHYRRRLLHLFVLIRESPPYTALLIFAVFIGLALLLDVKLVRFRGSKFLEEIIELNAALTLLFVCLCVYVFPGGAKEPTAR